MSVSLVVVSVVVVGVTTVVRVVAPGDQMGLHSPGGGSRGGGHTSPLVRGAPSQGLGYHRRPYQLGDDLQWGLRGRRKLSLRFQFAKVGRVCFLNFEGAVAPSIMGAHVQVVASGWSVQVATHSRFVFSNEAGLLLFDPCKQYVLSKKIGVSRVTNMSVVAGGVEVGEREDGIGLLLHVVLE